MWRQEEAGGGGELDKAAVEVLMLWRPRGDCAAWGLPASYIGARPRFLAARVTGFWQKVRGQLRGQVHISQNGR
jgi:hypothetical protein